MLFFHTIFGYVCFFFSSRLRHTTSAFVTVVLTCDLPICAERDILSAADGCAVGELSVALWTAYDLREPLQPLAQGGSLGEDITGCISGLRGRYPDDRQLVDPGSSTPATPKKRWPLPLHGSLARRADHQDPCTGRCARSADPAQTDRRTGA